MTKFLSNDEAEIFFVFLKQRLKVSKAKYAREIKKHPVTISIQFKKGKVRRDQVVDFCDKFFAPIKFVFETGK